MRPKDRGQLTQYPSGRRRRPLAESDGWKGIHLMAPLDTPTTHHEAREYAEGLAENWPPYIRNAMTSAPPLARSGRIFLDCLRNGRGNTAVGAYSPRARLGFPIAELVTRADIEGDIAPHALQWPGRPAR